MNDQAIGRIVDAALAGDAPERLVDELLGCERRAPPPEYTCPITLDWLVDPVVAPSGHSFSRAAIMRHLATSRTDPVTRQPLAPGQLYPNRALRDAVERVRKTGS